VTLICMCRSTTTLPRRPVRYLSDLEAALGERKVDLVLEGPRARTVTSTA
jgi:hypothetical protein